MAGPEPGRRVNRDELVEAFAGFPDRLDRAARTPMRSAPPGEWGAAEIVRHLIAVEGEVWRSRLARVVVEDDPHWSWTEPGLAPGFEDAPIDTILAAFAAARASTVATVRALDGAGWARYGTHATYGRLDVAGLLELAIDHDEEHLEGIGAG
jgi:DinB superfamily